MANKKRPETVPQFFEEGLNAINQSIEQRIIRWYKTETFFDGFRNTYARVLITILSLIVLYGGLALCWASQGYLLTYIISLMVVLTMQAISVRFVFQIHGEGLLDEYQKRRKNRAYRRAYRSIRDIVVLAILLWMLYSYLRTNYDFDFGGWELLDYQRSMAIGVFLVGLISLQKYQSYGIKGDPFMSRDEVDQMRNS